MFFTAFTVILFGQTITAKTNEGKIVLLNSDGTWKYSNVEQKTTLPTKNSKSFQWKNGADEFVNVEFKYYLPDSINLDQKILDKVVMKTMVKSKYKLKNKYSFVPKTLTILYSKKEGSYNAICKYLGANSYGAVSETKSYFKFTEDGEVTSIL